MTDEQRTEYNALVHRGIYGGDLTKKDEARLNELGKLSVEQKKKENKTKKK